jgi:predicted O-linked N-acetylglucosamine transferase (SPINDLY family)
VTCEEQGLLFKLVKKRLRRKRPAAELNRLALEHHARGELDRAEAYFREAALQTPADVSAWTNLAATMVSQQKYAAAIPVLQEVIELEPQLAEAHLDLGVCYNRLKSNAEAIRHYRNAIALKPALAAAHANIVNAYLDCCQWDEIDRWTRDFLEYRRGCAVQDWAERLEPYCALTLFPGALHKEIAVYRARQVERSIESKAGAFTAGAPSSRVRKRIRVGYVSADLYAHAMAHLTFGLYEAHNREDFEVFAYSMGPDDGSVYRRHIEQTCDHFIDVRDETAELIARRIRSDEIDVLIDMMGYTAKSRPQIFAYRPAPVQVGYIGYPGTTGARYIDYFISDHIATPPGYESEFTEKLAFLPDCYIANDDRQPISTQPLSRAEFALPEHSFVYCGFNMARKIDRTIFSVWMEILREVPDSVLWLLRDDPLAETNLRKEARARHVDPDRLVFAERREKPVHLARHRFADLFLDAYVYNAHTGACDALWAGLPLLTCPGATFVTRVAASILSAAGLPELITRDLDEYRELAIRLARDRALLAGLKDRLARNRLTCALFDTRSYVRHLEEAYQRMTEIRESGRVPCSFSVAR